MENPLPAIPTKRYFTIGEVSELCGVKPYVLRYWEQEFSQLRPMKRRGNRRYYQHHEVLLIRRIRDLLYEQGFTISGARNRLVELGALNSHSSQMDDFEDEVPEIELRTQSERAPIPVVAAPPASAALVMKLADASTAVSSLGRVLSIRDELISIRSLLEVDF
jgi:DNA-binding transcriptional MerR regulator